MGDEREMHWLNPNSFDFCADDVLDFCPHITLLLASLRRKRPWPLFVSSYQLIGGIGGESTEACLPRPALTDVQIERAETLYVEGASRKNLQFTVHLPASSGKLVEPVKLRDAHSGGYKRTNCGTR